MPPPFGGGIRVCRSSRLMPRMDRPADVHAFRTIIDLGPLDLSGNAASGSPVIPNHREFCTTGSFGGTTRASDVCAVTTLRARNAATGIQLLQTTTDLGPLGVSLARRTPPTCAGFALEEASNAASGSPSDSKSSGGGWLGHRNIRECRGGLICVRAGVAFVHRAVPAPR